MNKVMIGVYFSMLYSMKVYMFGGENIHAFIEKYKNE